MYLYLTAFDKAGDIKWGKPWLQTDSLLDMNNHIKENHNTESELYFPLLNGRDKERLEESGKTILLFTEDINYYLLDVEHDNNKGILRQMNIDSILE